MITVRHGDCRDVLRAMPDKSVHCCVTSPPYFGLRDYGHASQIGLEAAPDAYVAEMVAVFREVRRVLRDDGILFLNLGDSYFGGGGGGGSKGSKQQTNNGSLIPGHTRGGSRRAAVCDTSDKEPEGSQANGCLCGSLCDVCRQAYRLGISHNGSRRVPTPEASISLPSHARKELLNGHLPTSDFVHPAGHSVNAIPYPALRPAPAAGQLRASHQSTQPEFSQQRPANSRPSDMSLECLVCGRSLADCAPVSAGTLGAHEEISDCNQDTASPYEGPGRSNRCICECCLPDEPYVGLTTASLKSKDLIGIPWRVAFALQADGWYLRQDIIWSKPNPMPESVTDRCTKAHEYIFLMSKSARYHYDADAIAEYALRPEGPGNITPMIIPGQRTGENANLVNGLHRIGPRETRNKRSVWEVATQPYADAHFATFPPALIEPCIKAGCPAGGTVLDPFGGAGTTGLVADRLGRNAIMIEISADYAAMSERRIRDDAGMFAEITL